MGGLEQKRDLVKTRPQLALPSQSCAQPKPERVERVPAPRTSRPPSYLLARCSASARSTLPWLVWPDLGTGSNCACPTLLPRRFSRAENIKTQSKVKSSEQRGIRGAILDQCRRVSKGSSRHLTAREPLRSPASRPRRQTAASRPRRQTAALTRRYPALEPHIEDLLPKKGDTIVCKCKDYIQIILDPEGEFMFFQCRNGPFIPTLRLLHKCVAAFVLRVRLRATNLTCPHLCPAGSGDTPGWG